MALRVDLLCDALAVSPGALRTIVSRLRRGFGDTTVVASQGRYRLAAPVDAALFATLLSQAAVDDDRIGALERALALWTGPAFEEFAAEAWAEPEVARLAELHVAQAIEAGPVKLTYRLAHAIVSVASGPEQVASDLLGEAAADGFRNVPPDLMWLTSMLGYATLAIELEDLGAAARLLAIIDPYAGQVATNLGPAAAYAGRLASLLGRHDVADQYLNTAFEIVDAFDWDYHRAAILMARAAARHRSFGQIDDTARAWLETAAGICVARGLPGMLAAIGELSR